MKSPLLALLLLLLSGAPAAGQPSVVDFARSWSNVTLVEDLAPPPGCRSIVAHARTLRLTPGDNGAFSGFYLRTQTRLWLRTTPQGCTRSGGGPDETEAAAYRSDSWLIQGQLRPEGSIDLKANWLECVATCDWGEDHVPTFGTRVALQGDRLVDLGDGSPAQFKIFTDVQQADADAGAAVLALDDLLKPLSDGECNHFYAASLDPVRHSRAAQDVVCSALRPIGRLMQPIVYSRPMFDVPISLAMLFNQSRGLPTTYVVGDVLVQRMSVMGEDGGGVIFTYVLRKQPDGSWRILDIIS